MSNNQCETHTELLNRAQSTLKKIYETIERQKQVLGSESVSPQFLCYDKDLELLMGEKERVVGALRQHDHEHGCQDGSVLWKPDEPLTN